MRFLDEHRRRPASLADHLPWFQVFVVTALFMLPGLVMTLTVCEPGRAPAPRTLSAAVVGTLVSVSGAIGFVALIVPHAVRLLVGSTHRRLLPLAAIWGATFLVWADVLARIVRPGVEIPLGVVTALVGAPVFLSILRRAA